MYRVVVADNDNTTAALFHELRGNIDVNIICVGSGNELFEQLASGTVPDILVTEAHLPDADVDSLLAGLQRSCPETLIIVVTEDSSKETSARVRMQTKPIFYFALKPLSTEEMQRVMDDALSVVDRSSAAVGLPDSRIRQYGQLEGPTGSKQQ
jgi:CheY-like chemotaxis protein